MPWAGCAASSRPPRGTIPAASLTSNLHPSRDSRQVWVKGSAGWRRGGRRPLSAGRPGSRRPSLMPSASAPTSSRSPRTSSASSSWLAASVEAERGHEAAAHRVELDQQPLHLVVEALELGLHAAAARASWVLSACVELRLRGSPPVPRPSRARPARRGLGERLVEQLRAAAPVLDRRDEAVDLVGYLLVGQLGALDRVPDRASRWSAPFRRSRIGGRQRRRVESGPSRFLRRLAARCSSTLFASSWSKYVRAAAAP